MSNSKENALAPVLTDIVNMQLNKKDLVELLEAEAEQELNNNLILAKKDLDDADSLFNTSIDNYITYNNNIDNKLCAKYIKELVALAATLDITENELEIEQQVKWTNKNTKEIKDKYNNIIYIYDKRGISTYLRHIVSNTASLNVSVKCTYNGVNLNFDRYIAEIKLPQPTINKLNALADELMKLYNIKRDKKDIVYEINKNISLIPKRIKELSAGITRSALNSSDKGKNILKLLNSLKTSNKNSISKQII